MAARNTTKLTKSGKFATKSYTERSLMLASGRTVDQSIASTRSDMFRMLVRGYSVPEVLQSIEWHAEFIKDCAAAKKINAATESAMLNGCRSLYREIKGIGQGVYLAMGTEVPAAPVATAVAAEPVPNGTYTVVLNGEYRTIKLRKDFRDNSPEGSQVAAFLSGPDNTADYTGFAFVTGTTVKVWGKYSGSAAIAKTCEFLAFLLSGRDNWTAAGNAYAKAEGKCFMCNRKLTNPDSLEVMIGPECRKKIAA